MAAKWMLCFVCAMTFSMVVSQTTQSLNGTQPSTSDNTEDDSVLDKSMQAFYDMVKGFLGVVQPHEIEKQEWFNLTQIMAGELPSIEDWQQYSNYLAGFAVCFVVGILFMIIMPIVGCCFCCCRCCNRCGGRKKVNDPKRAKCKRVSYCSVLLVLTTIMLAGVVCSFVANDLIHKYLQNENNRGPIGKIESAFSSIIGYVNDTVDDVEKKALHAFDDTKDNLVSEINSTGSTAVDRVTDMINATHFINEAERLSEDVTSAASDLNDLKFYLENLKSNGTKLTEQLEEIKMNISSFCTTPCQVNTSQYETDADFTGLDDLQSQAGNVSSSLNMSDLIKQAKKTVDDAKAQASLSIETQISEATKTLDKIRGSIDGQIKEFKTKINNVTSFARDGSNTLDDAITPEVRKYFDYVWYAGFGVCAVYLLIVVCFYMGVLFGICGERPGYDAPCCNRGTGANFLMAGVGFSFIFSWLLMLLTAIFFLIGGPVYTEGCRYFDSHDPEKIKFISDAVSQEFDLSKLLYNNSQVDLNIVTMLQDCKDNKPVYAALKLENLVNLSSLINLTEVNENIDEISKQNFNLTNINIVSADLKKKIEDFGKSGLDKIDFSQFDAQMSKKLTKAKLGTLASQLDSAADNTPSVEAQLRAQAANLRELERTFVANMERDVVNLNRSLSDLKKHMGIQNRTTVLVEGLEQAQTTFNTNSSKLVKELITQLTGTLKQTASRKVKGLISDVEENVGPCRPVYDGVYMLTDAVCKTALDPFNSLWFSWGWCLFFFIPSIIFAVKLAGLYRREDDYKEKDFDDANFSMYGGDVRNTDTIPLTSIDNQHGGSGYPGMANSGYHQPYDHHGRQPGYSNGYHSNGYPVHHTGDNKKPLN